jgi:hypothetical protein
MPAPLARRLAAGAATVAAVLALPAAAGAVDFARSHDVDTSPASRAVTIARPAGRFPATVIIPGGADPEFWTFRFGADGALALDARYHQVPGPSSAVVAATFDATRGVDDLAIANSGGEGVSLDPYYVGIGFFAPQIDGQGRPQTFPTGSRPAALAAAPFDLATKDADLATANAGDDTVTTWRSAGFGKLADRADAKVGKDPRAVAIGRFTDHDFRLFDIAVAVAGEDRIVFLERVGPHLNEVGSAKAGNAPTALAAADYNGDGLDDLAIGHAGGDVSVLLGRRGGHFEPVKRVLDGDRGGAIATADFDRDGKPDLAVTEPGHKRLTVLLGHGDGTFGHAQRLGTGARPEGIAARDVNGDGRPDIVTANAGDSTATTEINQG